MKKQCVCVCTRARESARTFVREPLPPAIRVSSRKIKKRESDTYQSEEAALAWQRGPPLFPFPFLFLFLFLLFLASQAAPAISLFDLGSDFFESRVARG
jgi:hypothetical protein